MVSTGQMKIILAFSAFGLLVWTIQFFTIRKTDLPFKQVIPISPNKTPSPSIYKHVEGKPCSYLNPKRDLHISLLSHWHELATRNGIEYIITSGSLLGQYRNKEAIPWEHDVDVLVSDRYYRILNASSEIRNFTQNKDEKFHLVAHPQFITKVEKHRTRWNCKGQVVPRQSDACAFIGPMARLIYRSTYIDIYHLIDMGKILHDFSENGYYERSDYYPLVQCTFMNISTWCPNNKKKILDTIYSTDFSKPSRVCKDGRWQ